jgi:hypothetical protein
VSVHEGLIKAGEYLWKDVEAVPISSLTRKILLATKKHKNHKILL